jgi:alpha-mannosidase
MPVTIDLALRTGEPFLRAAIRVANQARDHRMRAHFPLPFATSRSHADGAFDVVERGLAAEGGFELGLPTFPSRRWVDASDGEHGLAVLHQGTPEYELVDGNDLAVTLLRSVGWLSRQDLRTRSGPAGPALETPGAQLLGEHVLRLAVFPHAGDWRDGDVQDAAELFSFPLRSVGIRGHGGALPALGSALSIEPKGVRLSSLATLDGRTECRVFNATGEPVTARVHVGPPLQISNPAALDLFAKQLAPLDVEAGAIIVPLRPWEIATIRIC